MQRHISGTIKHQLSEGGAAHEVGSSPEGRETERYASPTGADLGDGNPTDWAGHLAAIEGNFKKDVPEDFGGELVDQQEVIPDFRKLEDVTLGLEEGGFCLAEALLCLGEVGRWGEHGMMTGPMVSSSCWGL